MNDEVYTNHLLDPVFKDVYSGAISSSTALKTDVCAYFSEWYNSFQVNKPQYDNFDILDHVKYAPNIMLHKILVPGTYEYRIQGEIIFDLVGKRNQGKIFSSESELPYLSRLASYLDAIVSTNTAVHSYGKLTSHNRSHVSVEALVMPLFDTNGKATHILSVLSPVK